MASLQEVRAALKEPITDLAVLQQHLSTVVDHIQSSTSSSSSSSDRHSTTFEKSVAAIQALLLENALPAWSAVLEPEGEVKALLEDCFAPSASGDDRTDPSSDDLQRVWNPNQRQLATAYSAYQTLSSSLSSPTTSPHLYPIVIALTSTLVHRYSLIDLWKYAFGSSKTASDNRSGSFVWEQAVKLLVALPTRATNAYGRAREAGVQGISTEEIDQLNGS